MDLLLLCIMVRENEIMQRGDEKKSACKATHGVCHICVNTIHSVALLLVVLPFSLFLPPLPFPLFLRTLFYSSTLAHLVGPIDTSFFSFESWRSAIPLFYFLQKKKCFWLGFWLRRTGMEGIPLLLYFLTPPLSSSFGGGELYLTNFLLGIWLRHQFGF